MKEQFLWVEKYRPKTVKETILPEGLKAQFQGFVDQKNIPNLILSGRAGVGKTTIARAMLEELKCDYTVINSSLDRNIDTLRDGIKNYASAVSLMDDGRKYVILDEADYLNPNSTQPALRNFMEEYAHNCGFILTCNFKNKIIEPLHSRCKVVDITIPKAEAATIANQFYKRLLQILKTENIEHDPKVIAALLKKFFPDWRRTLNELQGYASTGRIDTGILTNFDEVSVKQLVGLLKNKDFTTIRKWVAENANRESTEVFSTLYSTANDYLKPQAIPLLVLLLAKYQYQASFAVDSQINLTACLVEVMNECAFQ